MCEFLQGIYVNIDKVWYVIFCLQEIKKCLRKKKKSGDQCLDFSSKYVICH